MAEDVAAKAGTLVPKRRRGARTTLPPLLGAAFGYVEDVLAGRIVASEPVRLACERHVRDMDARGARGLIFDEATADRVLRFFPQVLRHSKGEWGGKPVELGAWQQFRLSSMFGWKWRDSGLRRYRQSYNAVARKNGKSTEAAGVGLYMLTADGEPGAEVFSYATMAEQAKIVWNEAKAMIRKSPDLSARLRMGTSRISYPKAESWWRPLSRDKDSMDGLNPQCAIADELHAHKTSEAYDVMNSAFGSRRQPLHHVITTRGANPLNICGELDDYSLKVLRGEVVDDAWFAYIACLDLDDAWDDESAWIKANPNLRISVKVENLRDEALKAREMPSRQNEFRRKRCNLWTDAIERWVDYEIWQRAAVDIDDADLAGRPFWLGLDLSGARDLTALVAVYDLGNGQVALRCRFWLPEEGIAERERSDRLPYRLWVTQGWLELTAGAAINRRVIAHALAETASKAGAVACAYDRWRIKDLFNELDDVGFRSQIIRPDVEGNIRPRPGGGFPLIEAGQGYRDMSPAVDELETLITAGNLIHGGNPVLTMCASNTVITKDGAGNRKFDKSKAVGRIDGVVAAAMAAMLRRRMLAGRTSIYEDQGLELL